MRASFLLILLSVSLTLGVVSACTSGGATTEKARYARDGRHFGGGNH